MCCCEQLRQRGCIWDDGVVCSTKEDILNPEALCAGSLFGRGISVFTNSKEEVESNADKVTQGQLFGVRGGQSLESCKVSNSDWDCQFWLGWWIFTAITFYLLLEGWPVEGIGLLLVRGAGFKVQLEGLGNECQRLLNSLSANLIFSSCMSISYPMGKGLDKGKLLWLRESSKERVGEAKEGDKIWTSQSRIFAA
jgi:hypothetical protein